jgi:hypothetical protein
MADTEQDKMDRLVAERRHNDIVKGQNDTIESLNKVAESIGHQNEQGIATIKTLIGEQQKAVSVFLNALKNIPAPLVNVGSPVINVEDNQEKVIISLCEIRNEIIESNNLVINAHLKVIEALENRLLPDTFVPIKSFGTTESVKVNYKPANLITKK